MGELNSGPRKTNPSSGREKDLNPGPPDYKSSALPLGHARLRVRDFPKDFPKDHPKDFPEDHPKDFPKDHPKDFPEDHPEDFPKDHLSGI